MKVFCYIDDRGGWGERLNKALEELGVDTRLFRKADEVTDSDGTIVYMHLDHLQFRERDKEVAEELALKKNVFLIPSIFECRLYDDKYLQYREFGSWMPATQYLTSRKEAEAYLNRWRWIFWKPRPNYPFISKSKEGASSSNIRFITTKEQAQEEIDQVFSEQGMPRLDRNNQGLVQKDYLLWQDFLPHNPNDWRVIILGQKYGMIAKRYNRKDVPFASGSGEWVPVSDLESEMAINEDVETILNTAFYFAVQNNLLFAGVDIIKDPKGKNVILELTQG